MSPGPPGEGAVGSSERRRELVARPARGGDDAPRELQEPCSGPGFLGPRRPLPASSAVELGAEIWKAGRLRRLGPREAAK